MGIHDAEEHIGLVAQEVQKAIPEAVTENSKGYLLVNNDPIIWAMLNAIKEQQRQIQQQQKQIGAQTQQIREQRRQIRLQQGQISRLNGKVGVLESALRATSKTAAGGTTLSMTAPSVFDGAKKHQVQSVATARDGGSGNLRYFWY